MDAFEYIDPDRVAVERLVHDLLTNIAELQSLRLEKEAAAHVANEEVNLGKALTALQVLCSHLAADGRPMLRVVK